MAEKEFEGDDPFEMVAARFPVPEGVDIDELTARVLIEEFALMGVPQKKMLHIFQSRFFAGTSVIYETRGEDFIVRLIDDVFGPAKEEVH